MLPVKSWVAGPATQNHTSKSTMDSDSDADDGSDVNSNAKAKKKLLAWRHSKAKGILFYDIADKRVPLNWKRGQLTAKQLFEQRYKDRAEFKIADFGDAKKFATRLSRLRGQMRMKYELAEDDAIALAHDRYIYPVPTTTAHGYPRWRGSEARTLLRRDLIAGKHKRMRPMVLHDTRPEYREFPLKVFRDHIYKELRKMKKKGRKKHGVRTK